MQRLRELDFLRGIAIILVLFRHQFLFQFTANMGWIGVDLFFVLSGFLVSGLLFQEYLKYGDIKPKRFLIRRGFKIYPIYYIFYPLYFFFEPKTRVVDVLADLTFTQNYFGQWMLLYSANWSLAVEEHFYISLSLLLWLGIKYKKILAGDETKKGISTLQVIIICIMAVCLILRLLSNYYFPGNKIENFTWTHLRIDSLLAGVFIAYLYYFKPIYFKATFDSNKILLCILCLAGLCWTPFISPLPSFFAKTIGFSFLYISFAILLSYFLLSGNINQQLNMIFTSPLVNVISKIGYCSYAIYIIHLLVIRIIKRSFLYFNYGGNKYADFILIITTSIVAGMLVTFTIEKYFLKLRNKFYPGRSALNIHAGSKTIAPGRA